MVLFIFKNMKKSKKSIDDTRIEAIIKIRKDFEKRMDDLKFDFDKKISELKKKNNLNKIRKSF